MKSSSILKESPVISLDGRVGRVDIYAFRCDEWVLDGQMDVDNKEQYLLFGISVAMSNKGSIMAVGLPN